MKNQLTIIAVLAITFTSAYASTTPEVLFTNAAVEVITVESLEIFTDAGFDTESENLVFSTTENMTVVQIFNSEGELEFQLPVMSNKVQINKNLFALHSVLYIIFLKL